MLLEDCHHATCRKPAYLAQTLIRCEPTKRRRPCEICPDGNGAPARNKRSSCSDSAHYHQRQGRHNAFARFSLVQESSRRHLDQSLTARVPFQVPAAESVADSVANRETHFASV